jgi:hypothetical protein
MGNQKKSIKQTLGTKPAPAPLRSLLIAFGIPTLVFSTGASITGYQNFWLGCALMASAALWFGFHLCRLPFSLSLRAMLISALVPIFGIIAWYLIVPAPLDVFISSDEGNYGNGADVFGMKLDSHYSELQVILTNNSRFDYSNLDVRFQTTRSIVSVGWSSGFNSCIVKAGVKAAGKVIMTNQHGERSDIPLDYSTNQVIAPVYRARCNSFLSSSMIEIIFAIRARKRPEICELHVDPIGVSEFIEFHCGSLA